MKQILFFIFFAFVAGVHCEEISNDYYDQTYLGEKDLGNYFGPNDGRFETNSSTEKFELLDRIFENEYLNSSLEEEIFSLSDRWISEIYPAIQCPNFYIAQNYSYIHYLYRLIGISYIFEAIREYNIVSYRLGLSPTSCSLSWNDTFKKCTPLSTDMKKFISRIEGRHLMGFEQDRLVRQSKIDIQKWIDELNNDLKNSKYSGIVHRRISFESLSKRLELSDLPSIFENICAREKQIMVNLCSEKDRNFGFNDVPIFTYLLQRSNVINVINDGGYGRSCLKRFTDLNKDKESKIPYLASLSEDIYQKIKQSSGRYNQGNIFIAGALKEFDDKGLDDFIFSSKKETPVEVPVVAVAPKPAIIAPKPTPVVITPRPKIAPRTEPIPEPIPVKKVSEFELTREKLFTVGAEKLPLNMEKFKNDFTFTDKMIDALKAPLADFQTRQGLEDMKRWDKLGSKSEPVRLIFLKFLIDNNLHTGLYNIEAVLGNHFYVVNDIDKVSDAVFIGLNNDESTNYQWQIVLYKNEIKKKVDKKKEAMKIKKK